MHYVIIAVQRLNKLISGRLLVSYCHKKVRRVIFTAKKRGEKKGFFFIVGACVTANSYRPDLHYTNFNM